MHISTCPNTAINIHTSTHTPYSRYKTLYYMLMYHILCLYTNTHKHTSLILFTPTNTHSPYIKCSHTHTAHTHILAHTHTQTRTF